MYLFEPLLPLHFAESFDAGNEGGGACTLLSQSSTGEKGSATDSICRAEKLHPLDICRAAIGDALYLCSDQKWARAPCQGETLLLPNGRI